MAKEKDEYYSSMPQTMLSVMIIGTIGCAIFGGCYIYFNFDWLLSCAITFGMFAYHIFIRFLSPILLRPVFHKRYNYKSKWFQPKSWKSKFYQFIRIKKWKAQVMTFDPKEFSLKLHSPEVVVNNMCHAEAVFDCTFVMLQRYNRPRFVKILERHQ